MKTLELKVPPPIVVLFIAGAMWGISQVTPSLEVPTFIGVVIAVTMAVVGAGMGFAGLHSFRRANTTTDPLKPETSSSLVTSGIYTVTRNPMYVGLLFMLIAWTLFLSNAWVWVGPFLFVLYMNRFQIAPEERVLSVRFGTAYSAYLSSVRRWL